MSKRAPGFARRQRDHYPTPAKAVEPLLPWLPPGLDFIEPCCGNGDLVAALVAAGLTCTRAFDLAEGEDALDIDAVGDPIITNPPYDRPLMHALLAHFIAVAPYSWLLLESDWLFTRQARRFIPFATDIVPIGRLKWIPDSPFTGKDNYAWVRFGSFAGPGPTLRP